MNTRHVLASHLVIVMVTLLLIGSLFTGACGTPSTSPAGDVPDYWPITAWRTSTPEAQGMDSAQLLSALQYADTAQLNLRTLTVVRNGYIVLDANYQPFSADSSEPVFSVTKSVISLLVGIALHDGSLKSINQTVVSFFPDRTIANPSSDKDAITVEDLLTMQSGLDCADDKLGAVIENSEDWVQSILDLPMASKPGTTFAYCSRGAHLLSAILTQATGMRTQAYAQRTLFDPLGIQAADVSWATDPQGISIGGYGLSLRPQDMAKLGLLLLTQGQWNGRQIVPADWITSATRSHVTVESGNDYGYLFWVYPNTYAAQGTGQQRITVVPDKNLIVVMTAAKSDSAGAAVQSLLTDYIVPAISSDEPLAENPSATTMLHAKIDELANPIEPVSLLPPLATSISGKTYQFPENVAGWNSLTVSFDPGSKTAEVTIDSSTGAEQATIGLDNVYRLSPQAGGGEIALRGSWTDDHTFVAHELVMGDISEYDVQMKFSGNQVAIHIEETVNHQLSAGFTGIAS